MKAIKFDSNAIHLTAAAAIAASAVLFAIFSVIWTISNTAASATDQKEVAALLTKLSPGDPQTHLASATLHESLFEPGDLDIALAEYEKAAAYSPNNYLFWLLLGSARVRAGDTELAEAAFRRASELAPNYSRVQWALGNLYLREGREDEGYELLKKAVASDPALSLPAVTIALQLAEGNATAVRTRFKDLPELSLRLALLLAEQRRFDEAAEVWRSIELGTSEPRMRDIAGQLKRRFYDAKRFRMAVEVGSKFAAAENTAAIGRVSNADIELPVRSQNADLFDWVVPQSNNPQFAVTDAHKLSGRFSLLAVFNNGDTKDIQGISQVVAVEPGRKYDLKIGYRADVRSKAEFRWEIRSAADAKQLAISPAMQALTDWTMLSVAFTAPLDQDGVELRLLRSPCIASTCNATGMFWFDDFVLNER